MLDRLLCWIGAHDWRGDRSVRWCNDCGKYQERGYDFMEPIWITQRPLPPIQENEQ